MNQREPIEDAKIAVHLCEQWAAKVEEKYGIRLFLFGSAIYREGEQFDHERSDLDLLAVIPESAQKPEGRAKLLKAFCDSTFELEQAILRPLARLRCDEPAISVVAATQLEIDANVHKGGTRFFFSRNNYWDLKEKAAILSIPGAGTKIIADEKRHVLEYVQRVRNQYLACAANGARALKEYLGPDPLPKELMRHAATLVPSVEPGAAYDTMVGLEDLSARLRMMSMEGSNCELHRTLAARRRARGWVKPLSIDDQLLLAEILYEAAVAAIPNDSIRWRLWIGEVTASSKQTLKVLSALQAAGSDTQIITFTDQFIVCSSSHSTYQNIRGMIGRGELQRLLSVDQGTITLESLDSELSRDEHRPAGISQLDRLIDVLRGWSPVRWSSERDYVENLTQYLHGNQTRLGGIVIRKNVRIARSEVDLFVEWESMSLEPPTIVEVTFAKTKLKMFNDVKRALNIGHPTVVVVITPSYLTEDVKQWIRESAISSMVRAIIIDEPEPEELVYD